MNKQKSEIIVRKLKPVKQIIEEWDHLLKGRVNKTGTYRFRPIINNIAVVWVINNEMVNMTETKQFYEFREQPFFSSDAKYLDGSRDWRSCGRKLHTHKNIENSAHDRIRKEWNWHESWFSDEREKILKLDDEEFFV